VEHALSRAKSDTAEIDRLKVDYEQTLATYRMLADIRFKLLAFVPTISGAVIALLSSKTVQLQFPVLHGREGHMRQRPESSRYLFNIYKMWHDRALAMIYGSVLGACPFPFCYALVSVAGASRQSAA
jgi:hypothetical protein